MGEKDAAEKTLEAHNDVFADITNALFFNGEQVITPDSLTDAQPFSQYKADDSTLHAQERDVAKYWNQNAVLLSFVGFENQTEPETAMPLRVISYDGAAYRSELLDKERRDFYPVVTGVLYFGTERHWTAPKSLKELLLIDSRLAPFVQDYRINVFELAWLTDEQIAAFKSDFHEVVEYLRAKRLHTRYEGSQKQLDHVTEILELFRVLSNDNTFRDIQPAMLRMANRPEGGVKMCDVIQAIKGEGISIGEKRGISIGEQRGISIGEQRGISIGENRAENKVFSLFSSLTAAGRGNDVTRAFSDREYFNKLMNEYQQHTPQGRPLQ